MILYPPHFKKWGGLYGGGRISPRIQAIAIKFFRVGKLYISRLSTDPLQAHNETLSYETHKIVGHKKFHLNIK